MQRAVQRRWLIFWAAFTLAVLTIAMCQGTTITLLAWVTYSLYDDSSVPLGDDSVVYIIGSKDNVNDGMQAFGTNYIADSVQGDDVFIGLVRIGYNTTSNGTFLTADFTFESDEVDYIYIRLFDTTMAPPEGLVDWGVSPLFDATNHPFDVLFLNLVGGYATTNELVFVVIPEPGSGQLLLLLAGLVWGIRASAKGGGNHTAEPRKVQPCNGT